VAGLGKIACRNLVMHVQIRCAGLLAMMSHMKPNVADQSRVTAVGQTDKLKSGLCTAKIYTLEQVNGNIEKGYNQTTDVSIFDSTLPS
jgi:hypothetical protein